LLDVNVSTVAPPNYKLYMFPPTFVSVLTDTNANVISGRICEGDMSNH